MKRILRRKVAREAARLLYYNHFEEYKQAKEEAARICGVKFLPSNFEVAVELDRLAGEVEGADRDRLIVELRWEALEVMKRLKAFHPRLIGSVWRGTARRGSDIDIEAYSHETELVLKELEKTYQITGMERTKIGGEADTFQHIHFKLSTGQEVEVVVKGLERLGEKRKCDVYGDLIAGLTLKQLERILEEDPNKRFISISARRLLPSGLR